MKKLIIPFLLLAMVTTTYSFMPIAPKEKVSEGKINWMTWEEAVEKSKTTKKKIFIDIYTQWCGWCKRMNTTTFNEAHIADYINKHYYPVKFDAEQTDPITFKGTTYKFVKSGKRGYHKLAMTFAQGNLSFPTFIFMDENQEVLQPFPGYLDAKKFEKIMTFYGDNHFKTIPWSSYQKDYKPMDPKKD